MEFRCLGPLEARLDGTTVGLGEPQQRLVLAILLANAGEVVSTDRLVDDIWGDVVPGSARKIVQGYVSGLRKALGSNGLIESRPPGYRIEIDRSQLDAHRFSDLVAEATGEVTTDPTRSSVALRDALAMWHGSPFEDLADYDALRPESIRLEMLRSTALQARIEADIYVGGASSVVAELADLTRREPLQERLWALRMLALYRAGRQADALRVFGDARRELIEAVGLEPSTELRLVEQRILDQDPILETTRALSQEAALAPPTKRNPYKGLRSFNESDAVDFHGRDKLIRRLREALDRRDIPRLVVLAGPSGSGKSSVARAGLLPLLRVEGWQIGTLFPGSAPVAPLEAALPSVADAPTSIILVDQLEEVFALTQDEVQPELFLNALSDLVESGNGPWILATVRADFLDRLLAHLRFARLLENGLLLITPLEDYEVRDVIVRPATSVGTTVEPDLIAAAVREVANRSTALPLLEYTLTDLYDRAGGRPLTLEAFQTAGGLGGSLVKRAEELYEQLDVEAKETARQVFLRLVTLTDEGEPMRRRLPSASLEGLVGVDEILELFGRHRLLTFDRDSTSESTVEVAHEALLGQWPRLANWVGEARDSIRLNRQLAETTAEWRNGNRSDAFLLTGPRLARFAVAHDSDIALTGDEQSFLDRSRKAETRQRRRQAVIAWGAVAVFAVLAATAIFQRQAAKMEAREATVRQLAGESILALAEDPQLSILLALEGVDISMSAGDEVPPEAIAALQQAVQGSRLELTLNDGVGNVAFSPDGSLLVTDSINLETGSPTNEVLIWDSGTGARLRTLAGSSQVSVAEIRPEGGGGTAITFSPDGGLLAVAYQTNGDFESPIILWDPSTGEETGRLMAPGFVSWNPLWSPDGAYLVAASWDGATDFVTVWERASGRKVVSFEPGFVGQFALYDDRTIVVSHGPENRVGFYDLLSGDQLDVLETPGLNVNLIAVDHIGDRLVLGSRHQDLQIWDLKSRSLQWTRPISSSRTVAVNPDGEMVALAGDEGLIRLLDLDNGAELMVLAGHSVGVYGTVFHPDGEAIASVGTDGETRIWDISANGSPALGAVEIGSGDPFIPDFSPDGTEVGIPTWDGTFEVRGSEEGELIWLLDGLLTVAGVHPVVSYDWSSIASVSVDGAADVRALGSSEPTHTLPACTNPRALSPDASAVVLDGIWLCLPTEAPPGAELRSRVIDIPSGEELLDLGERLVFRAAFNPEGEFEGGRYLAVNVNTETLEIYDMMSGNVIVSLDVLPTLIRFDPTGRYLASGTLDGRVIVLDLTAVVGGATAEDALIMDQNVAPGGVPGIAISANGVLATSAFDSSFIRLWDFHTGRLITELRTSLDGSSPPHLNFSPDGSYLLYPDAGHVLRKFFLDTQQLIELAESRVVRGLTDDECRRYLEPSSCQEPSDGT